MRSATFACLARNRSLLLVLFSLAEVGQFVRINRPLHRIGRNANPSRVHLPDQRRRRISPDQFICTQPHGRQGIELYLQRRIVDPLRMKLLVDPALHPDLLHALHIARPRPKGQSVQRMFCALALRQRDGLGYGVGLRACLAGNRQAHQAHRQQASRLSGRSKDIHAHCRHRMKRG